MFKYKLTKGKTYTSLCTVILLTLCLPMVSRAVTDSKESSASNKSSLYIELVNYTMPIIEVQNTSEDESSEPDFSIKEKLLQFVGLDITSPLSIVNREFNLIQTTNPELAQNSVDTPFIINPFRLNENNIIKNASSTNPINEVTIPDIKTSEVYNPKIKKSLNPAKPEVLIYHTHTTESYSPNPINTYDMTQNVSAVGEIIKNDLEKNYGVSVIHDKTIHSVIFNESYSRSGQTLDKYLKEYKDFKLIIDLHRDSQPNKAIMTAAMNDTKLARYEFVLGPGNPNKDKNLAVIKKFISISQSLFPGLVRPGNKGDLGIFYHKPQNKFNQQKSPNAVLIEIGSMVNTVDEAKATGVYISRIIAEYINQTK